MKTKTTTALLAFFFGGFGLHRFYLGQKGKAVVSLLFFWTLIPTLIGIIDFIVFISMEDERFNEKYNSGQSLNSSMNKRVCSLCAYELKRSNSLSFNSGRIKEGGEICIKCFKRINEINPSVAFNLKNYDIVQIKKLTASNSKYSKTSNQVNEFENRPIPSSQGVIYNVPEAEETEETGMSDIPNDFQTLKLNTLIQINYIDSLGQKSERRITIKSITQIANSDYLITAYCHEKEAIRSFKLSHIERLVDIETGEIFNEPLNYFVERFSNSPLGLLTKVFQEIESEILILSYVARSDGYLRKKERDLIANYILLRSREELDMMILDEEIRRTYCERTDLKKSLKSASLLPEENKVQLFEYAQQIVETDKKIDPIEMGVLELIKQELNIK